MVLMIVITTAITVIMTVIVAISMIMLFINVNGGGKHGIRVISTEKKTIKNSTLAPLLILEVDKEKSSVLFHSIWGLTRGSNSKFILPGPPTHRGRHDKVEEERK